MLIERLYLSSSTEVNKDGFALVALACEMLSNGAVAWHATYRPFVSLHHHSRTAFGFTPRFIPFSDHLLLHMARRELMTLKRNLSGSLSAPAVVQHEDSCPTEGD